MNISRGIVDKYAIAGFEPVSFQKYFKNYRVGFGYFLTPRNGDRFEKLQKIVFLLSKVKSICGPVCDCVEFVTFSGKILQNFWHCFNSATKHLIPSCHPGNDRIAILRACPSEFFNRYVLGFSRIHLLIPLIGNHFTQKELHVRFVSEKLPVKIARVPVNQNSAKIKDNDWFHENLIHSKLT